MLNSDRFVLFSDATMDHDFNIRVINIVNRATDRDLDFGHPDYADWADEEPGFSFLDDDDYKKIKGRHAVFFSCPLNFELAEQLEMMTHALKDQYGAKSVTVVMRFLRYRRQDRVEKEYEVTCLRLFIRKLKILCGVDNLIVVEPHNAENTKKYCNEFGLNLFICDPTRLFAEAIGSLITTFGHDNAIVYSPDLGSAPRAIALAKAIKTGVVATPKERLSGSEVEVENGYDEVALVERIKKTYGEEVFISCNVDDLIGKHVFMRDDEVATASTSAITAKLIRKVGAKSVHFLVTHPVCTSGWKKKLVPRNSKKPFESLYFGNARPRGKGLSKFKESTGGKVQIVPMEPIIAEQLIQVLEGISD